jgi:hypothetical protein
MLRWAAFPDCAGIALWCHGDILDHAAAGQRSTRMGMGCKTHELLLN